VNPFFAGLVERATLRAPVLERRPRSLFEPVAGAVNGLVATDRAEQAERGDPDGFGDRPRPPAEQDDSSVGSGGEPATSGAPGARLTRLERSTAETPHHLDNPVASASSPARHAGDEQRLVLATTSQHGKHEQFTRLETTLATALPLQFSARENGHPPRLALMSTQPYPPKHATDVAHGPPHARSVQPASADSLTTGPAPTTIGGPPARTSVPLLQAGPHIPGPPALLVRSQGGPGALQPNGIVATPPAPVHVTIGRIEVRANPPAADRTPVRRPPAGPRMSLDDYLNGRRGGSR